MKDTLWWRLLCSALAAATVLNSGLASAESGTALLKLQRNVCYPESSATSRFLGLPTRISCIFECAKASHNFDAVQILPGASPGLMDCECIKMNASSPGGRMNCERWDVQAMGGGSGSSSGGTGSSATYWNATTCPAIGDAWNPVVDINKCIFMRNDVRLTFPNVISGSPCQNGNQLFNLKDSYTESLLVKYVTYLNSKGVGPGQFWVNDYRSGGTGTCSFVVANGNVIRAPGSNCSVDADPKTYELNPICEKTLCFIEANPSEIQVVSNGGNNLLWRYFNNTMVPRNEACQGSLLALIETEDMFGITKTGITSRGWTSKQMWIAGSVAGSYIQQRTSIVNSCITLMVNSTTDNISAAGVVAVEDCNAPHHQLCEAMMGSGPGGTPMPGSGMSVWLVGNVCPTSVQPPPDALSARTVGNLCYFYTATSYSMNPLPSSGAICNASGAFTPALISSSGDFWKSRSYISSMSLPSNWDAWLWSNGWNGDFIDGVAISSVSLGNGSGAYFLNNTGSPFRGDASIPRPVICHSTLEICNSTLNYMNYVSSTNSCVAVEMDSVTQSQSVSYCAAKASGTLLKLESADKFNQIRDFIVLNGHENKLFWVDNSTTGGNCSTLQITSPGALWTTSVMNRPCDDRQNYLCEKPYGG